MTITTEYCQRRDGLAASEDKQDNASRAEKGEIYSVCSFGFHLDFLYLLAAISCKTKIIRGATQL